MIAAEICLKIKCCSFFLTTTAMSTQALLISPITQAKKHTHTLSLTLALNPSQPQTSEVRGDTSKVGVRKVAATFTAPHPNPTLP